MDENQKLPSTQQKAEAPSAPDEDEYDSETKLDQSPKPDTIPDAEESKESQEPDEVDQIVGESQSFKLAEL